MSHTPSPEACAACPAHHIGNLVKLGVDMSSWDYVVALAGTVGTGPRTLYFACFENHATEERPILRRRLAARLAGLLARG